MRHVVVGLAVLAFAAGLILNTAGVVQLALFCAAGGCGVPQRWVLLGLGGIGALALVAWRWRRGARLRPGTSRRPRPAGRPATRAVQPRQRRGTSRRKA